MGRRLSTAVHSCHSAASLTTLHKLPCAEKPFLVCLTKKHVRMQVEKDLVKAIQHMEEVEVEVKKKKEISSKVKDLRKQVRSCSPRNWWPVTYMQALGCLPSPARPSALREVLTVSALCVQLVR